MNKITVFSNVNTREKMLKALPELAQDKYCVKFFSLDTDDDTIIAEAGDTEILVADAMATVSDRLISGLEKLRFIQSEGVGYQGFDLDSAKRNGVTVSNNKGVNDTAVAETAVLLILACLKNLTSGQTAVYEGRQMEVKAASFGVIRELSECTVGLVGFGDIARAAAKMLGAFGARVIYTNRTRYEELEAQYGVEYVSLDGLLSQSDFVSLHLAACEDTREYVNAEFLKKMKKRAYLINTSRGELVNNEALLNAILCGEIAGAGLDVIFPEPVKSDNILLDERIKEKLVLTPHIAGITSLTIKKIYSNILENILRVIDGREPINIISG